MQTIENKVIGRNYCQKMRWAFDRDSDARNGQLTSAAPLTTSRVGPKLLESNPTLMRLRELEVLEKVATDGKLNVVLGEKGLTDRVVNLL